MGPHEGVAGAQVGELLPAVARHLAEQRALAVDDFVVAQRQDEVLAEGIDQAEGHLVVVMAAVDRVLAQVFQRVVHPAHVPLRSEEHTSELQSLMRISYAVFCLTKKKNNHKQHTTQYIYK